MSKLTLTQAAALTGLPRSAIKVAVERGVLPAFIPPGLDRRRLYFEEADLLAWVEAASTRPHTPAGA